MNTYSPLHQQGMRVEKTDKKYIQPTAIVFLRIANDAK